jgi:vacuolar-type H+-ATPase subunit F/Vma7
MIKPKNKQELLDLLKTKNFKIVLIDENQASLISDQIKRLNHKKVTVIVLE